jgi:hypothetical protein
MASLNSVPALRCFVNGLYTPNLPIVLVLKSNVVKLYASSVGHTHMHYFPDNFVTNSMT